jgi:hypothetical protein
MMILHASIAANDPQDTAQTLAQLIGGVAFPLPGDGGAWGALNGDGEGTLIEVLRRGREYHRRDGDHCDMVWGDERRHGATHLMVETPLDEEAVLSLAAARGCQAHRARHGFFDVVEFWIDDCQLLDVVTPEMAKVYKAFNAKAFEMIKVVSPDGGARA